MKLVIKWWWIAFLLFVSLSAIVSCNTPNKKWENNPDNDRIVHIHGTIDNLSPRDVRVCLTWTDCIHGDDYYSIQVKKGSFYADVPMDAEKVYKLLIPWKKNYSYCRSQVFFADQDTLLFVYDAHENNKTAADLIQKPKGSNLDYLSFRAEKQARFAEERQALQDEYRSIKNHFETAEYERLCKQLADKKLDRFARDSVKLLLGQINQDRTAYTPEGRAHSVGDAYGLREKAGSIFLIDKDGVIIKVNPTKEELEATLRMK